MNTNDRKKPVSGELVSSQQHSYELSEKLLAHLPEEKRRALTEKVVEGGIELQQLAKEAAQALDISKEEMDDVVRHVRELHRTGVDFKVTYRGKTASGEWRAETKKNNSMVIVVIVVVIGIVALLALTR